MRVVLLLALTLAAPASGLLVSGAHQLTRPRQMAAAARFVRCQEQPAEPETGADAEPAEPVWSCDFPGCDNGRVMGGTQRETQIARQSHGLYRQPPTFAAL